ncbi:MAG: 4-hydroxythreonine-4-phosphate dehydrogenase PdxA [Endomicrobia bacterium]|nr:4-hydroxythreonine-4-phosphate dehydrogenase PdxA [Endomicrobiia bacterium]
MSKPRIAVTMGDPAGIGPEIVYRAVNSLKVQRVCSPVVFGTVITNDELRMEPAPERLNRGNQRRTANNGNYEFIAASNVGKVALGKPSKKAGIAAYSAIKAAAQFCLDGKADALVTAPVSKESFKLAGVNYPGHTELLQALTKSKNAAMMMVCGNIHSVMVTRHIPLSEVSKRLKSKDIVETVSLAVSFLNKSEDKTKNKDVLSLPSLHSSVKIALCGLNPHAGDNGILGKEEKKIIFPAYEILKKSGFNISKPLPADSAWLKTKNGEFGLICGMYHDQIMIPLKCIDAKKIVNVTAGLPFVRTSPGHGTAFDIAGKGKADADAMIESILYAAEKAITNYE